MKLWVNGEAREVRDDSTVADLLKDMKIVGEAVAVEVNRAVIRRAQHAAHRLAAEDRVEVVTFVGGG